MKDAPNKRKPLTEEEKAARVARKEAVILTVAKKFHALYYEEFTGRGVSMNTEWDSMGELHQQSLVAAVRGLEEEEFIAILIRGDSSD